LAVKQKPRRVGSPCRHFGDGTDLETRIGALDTPQRSELVDKLDEFAQVLVHCFAPAAARVPSIAGRAPCGQTRFHAMLPRSTAHEGQRSWPSFATSRSSFPILKRPPSFSSTRSP